ncbi:hypothetical protein GCM10016455_05630 [Aliiroseovarius zhejiangensis]|uniref:Lipoprotein n=1 Tax=Aliiroseovarius zhejiangensis TaxID=1632025 RepID=A0ABQ3IQ66_9RHOB|nr:hypothetical protein [Aliiroseovarius zhejiangensis]GHE88373.1 hypothetical protein GCM10016455_05630 [Aliiroseovarius zhejiangensis]
MMIVTLIGVTGCATRASEPGLCAGLRPHVAALSDALAAHPNTPDPVGEAGTDVVIGFGAGCRVKP